MVLQIARQHLEIGKCALRWHEMHLLNRARRVVDRHDQGAGFVPGLEPAVIGPVDLDQRAIAFPAQPRPMEHAPLRSRQPEPIRDHPFAQRLARNMHAISFGQLLGHQCRAKVGIAFAHERHRVGAQAIADPVVRRSPARLVPDRCSTFLPEDLQQPLNLTLTQAQHCRRMRHRHAAFHNTGQNLDPVNLALAHQHPSHVACSLKGTTATF